MSTTTRSVLQELRTEQMYHDTRGLAVKSGAPSAFGGAELKALDALGWSVKSGMVHTADGIPTWPVDAFTARIPTSQPDKAEHYRLVRQGLNPEYKRAWTRLQLPSPRPLITSTSPWATMV